MTKTTMTIADEASAGSNDNTTPLDMSDQDKLITAVHLLENGVEINTAFIKDEDNPDVYTHQVLRVSCGEFEVYSSPEAMQTPLKIATAEDLGQRVN